MATEIVPSLDEITANVNEITANNKRSSFSKLFGSTPRELKRKTHTITIERASRSVFPRRVPAAPPPPQPFPVPQRQ